MLKGSDGKVTHKQEVGGKARPKRIRRDEQAGNGRNGDEKRKMDSQSVGTSEIPKYWLSPLRL